jgi:peptidoglycan DL-endopeptidase CwlO
LATGLITVVLSALATAHAEEPSLGEKIKKFFATPTPTPSKRRQKPRKSSPTPSPNPTAFPKSTIDHKYKSSPTPTPEEEETPKTKRKKSSPASSPSPTETPAPASEESPSPSPVSPSPSRSPENKVATVSPSDIEDYEKNPEPVRKLLDDALALTKRNLDYTYGSADPENGGMDCSGFVYYVLRTSGVKDVPRDSSEQYVWLRKSGNFRAVLSRNIDSFELDELKPGDLLFWAGTYSVERDPPVTHSMIYLGKEKATGKPIMVGASDGRTYEGEQQFGVSVFDFKTARAQTNSTSGTHPRFVGYGKIPGLGDENP